MAVTIPDELPDDPRILAASERLKGSNKALALLGFDVAARAYLARHASNDGVLPTSALTRLGGSRAIQMASALVSEGVWLAVSDGFLLPDYVKFNPGGERIQEKRKADAERQRRHRESQRGIGAAPAAASVARQQVTGDVTPSVTRDVTPPVTRDTPRDVTPPVTVDVTPDVTPHVTGLSHPSSRARDPFRPVPPKEYPPNPPSFEGGLSKPITRAERKKAERVREGWGRCCHDPRCETGAECVARIVRAWREDEAAVLRSPPLEPEPPGLDEADVGVGV